MVSLLVLPLPAPHILLPGTQIKLAVDGSYGQQLVNILREAKEDSLGSVQLAAVPLREKSNEEFELNEWGCAARLSRLQVARSPDSSGISKYFVTLVGQSRVRILDIKNQNLIPTSSITSDASNEYDSDILRFHPVEYPPRERTPRREVVTEFKSAALKLLDHLIEGASNSNIISNTKAISTRSHRNAWSRFATMVEEISDNQTPWLADLMVWSIIQDYTDKLDFLPLHDTDARLKRATELFIKHTSISEVSQKIAKSVDESLHKQQKEFFLRQQLAAIQRELAKLNSDTSMGSRRGSATGEMGSGSVNELDAEEGPDDEEMADIRRKIEAMEHGSEERKMAVREWRRMKRIPPQSVEYGVLRTYLEWLTAVPWPSSNISNLSNDTGKDDTAKTTQVNQTAQIRDRSFLSRAKEQLDKDHYGLEKIKRRLIEYLAVIRLRQISEEAEEARVRKDGESGTETAITSKELVLASTEKSDSNSGGQTPSPAPSVGEKKARAKGGMKGPILLFVGPPGTGKTSLGQSIARALGRPFQRISLGGVRDEAEIRGHRRTYVASGPGLLVQALRKAGRADPVLLLDELDKVGHSTYHSGDVSSALLEVLDPEQNHTFTDHYINVPIDLSQVTFICTANTLDTIPLPLLDRCEVVELSGYTHKEKVDIAKRYLMPKQLKANGLEERHVVIPDEILEVIVRKYTNEAGVRGLERVLGAVIRAKAVLWAEAVDNDVGRMDQYDPRVREEDLETILGIGRWEGEGAEGEREAKKGMVYGLVVTGQGEGGILPVETTAIPVPPSGSGGPGMGGRLKLTGSLGEVIKESGEIALSWVKTNAWALGVASGDGGGRETGEMGAGREKENGNMHSTPLKFPFEGVDIHLHLPSGAQKKDGPSAGVAMACAFVSLLTGAIVPANVAMTGEITLRGRVTPVGGIKEKVLGAHRANITKVILPYANRKDVEHDVPAEVRDALEFVFVRTVEEALEAAFGPGVLVWKRGGGVGENSGVGLRRGPDGNVLVESRL